MKIKWGVIGLLVWGLFAAATAQAEPSTNFFADTFVKTKAKAEQGDATAQSNLASMHANGDGVPKDDAEAEKWYCKAAEQGSAEAQYALGYKYANGQGVTKDEGEAVKWYRKAAERGSAMAQYSLGYMYAKGLGVMKDEVEAYKWFLLAGAQGNENAKKYMPIAEKRLTAAQVAEGQRLAREFKPQTQSAGGAGALSIHAERGAKAFASTKAEAEKGDAKAQHELGFKYYLGEGVAKDNLEAYKWLLLPAAQGDEIANSLARVIEFGLTPAQRAEGQKWAREWRSGMAAAEVSTRGKGDQATPTEARPSGSGTGFAITEQGTNSFAEIKAKAEKGDAEAQYNLGLMYSKGEGVPKDAAEAVKWWRKAAEQGLATAQINLGLMYYKGEGVAKDKVEAVKWFRKAAEQGDAMAQCILGAMYEDGEGVAKDEVEAYKWFLVAGAQGNEGAKKRMTFSERRLTPAQRAEAEKRAREFKLQTQSGGDAGM